MANPSPGAHKSAGVGKKQREIPDPIAYMKAHMSPNEGSPGEEAGESPAMEAQEQAFGIDKPTQGDGRQNGINVQSSKGPETKNGNPEPASKSRGSGKKKTELSPNNKKKAGPMVKAGGKPPFGMPSREAIGRKLVSMGTSKAPAAQNASGRTGILSHFEGFSPNKG